MNTVQNDERKSAVKIKNMDLIYFSPTQTTKRVLEGIAEGIPAKEVTLVDLTLPASTQQQNGDFAVIGVPVYGGRVPIEAEQRLRQLNASNTPAAIVVLYGNREFEDALLELKNIAADLGFIPIAGGAFIGEHSYATKDRPIAMGRPDPQDLEKAKHFGEQIRDKISGLDSLDKVPELEIPGNFPYKERKQVPDMSPITQETLCTTCGTCASICPTSAITVNEAVTTRAEACIRCCACVKSCPTEARIWDNPRIKEITEWLYTNYHKRKEPEVFVSI